MNEKIKKHTIDFTNVKTYFEMHSVIRDSLDFPFYYGCNWDACWDCLHERINQPIHIQIIGLEVLQQDSFSGEGEAFIDLLRDFKHYKNDKYADTILIEIIDQKNGTKMILE